MNLSRILRNKDYLYKWVDNVNPLMYAKCRDRRLEKEGGSPIGKGPPLLDPSYLYSLLKL